jgi:hypothetical protein
VLFLSDGRLVGELQHPTAEHVADHMTRLTERRAAAGVEASAPW